MLGTLCSFLTLAPYAWRRHHAGHHSVWNSLDRRDGGLDLYSIVPTIAEYRALLPWGRLVYRISRHPLVANAILPPFIFLILYRLPFHMPEGWRREHLAIHLTNAVLVALILGLGSIVGLVAPLPCSFWS